MLWREAGNVPVTIKINKGVVHYFQSVRDGEERLRERSLYWNLFKVLREVALVTDPKERLPMFEVCARLEEVISDSKSLQQLDKASTRGRLRTRLSAVLAKVKSVFIRRQRPS
jgi:hypothetical protein